MRNQRAFAFLRIAAYFQIYDQGACHCTNERAVHLMLVPASVWYVPRSVKPISAAQLLPRFKREFLEFPENIRDTLIR